MKIKFELINGVFIEECKNRFMSKVIIENKNVEECYIAVSSKLKNYLNMIDKEVLLRKNIGRNIRTRYTIFAVKGDLGYTLLDYNMVNHLVMERIINYEAISEDKILMEKTIEGYKCDLLINNDAVIIVEIKALIPTVEKEIFPTVFSQRAIEQLYMICNLLDKGYKVEYYIIGLNNIMKTVEINKGFNKYYDMITKCINKGLILKAFNLEMLMDKGEVFIKDIVEVLY
jgi:DNA-binding sugar fermentation-stimulating protein